MAEKRITEAQFSMQCSFIAKNAAAWAGDLLTLPEHYNRQADTNTVARFTDEMRARLDRLDAWAGRAGEMSVTVEDINAAFDPADEAFGGAFKAGFREGWLFAKSPDFEDREEAEEDYPHVVDIAPSECWDAYREVYFAKLPLAAVPRLTVQQTAPASKAKGSNHE